MAVEQALGFVKRRPDRDSDQVVLGHQLADAQVKALLESQVTVRQDPDKLAGARDRDARNAEAVHQVQRIPDAAVRRDRDRIHDHPGLAALDSVDLLGLPVDRHVAVDDA